MTTNNDLDLLKLISDRLKDDPLNLTDEFDQENEKDQKETDKKLTALQNWKEKYEGEEWLEQLEEELKELSDSPINEQDLKDKSSDEIFNLICQRLDKENWIKFASDLQLIEEEETDEKDDSEQLDSAAFLCLLKDKWLNGESTLSIEQTDKLKDALKKIGREDILEAEEFQNSNPVPTDLCTDTIEDDISEGCVTAVQKVVQVVTEHSKVLTSTSHSSEEKDEDEKDEKEEKLVASVKEERVVVEKRTEFSEKTQTIETKQEVIVSTQKTVQVVEEEIVKEADVKVEVSPSNDKEAKETNGETADEKQSDADCKEKDDSIENKENDKSKENGEDEEESENREQDENQEKNGTKDKVEIPDSKDDGKKKKKRSIPKLFSCFSKKEAD
ncbi:DgyrCDS8571 [Dimorphilus gyrociliatus]|uniref:DgyrCDS8571 n=1 Tax=Dimorphilus gyrociliatus TaxID=2664684 RepID=A0A7I8VVJ9_9ANNE|nr:DgyrCDS8571 [Dimorphilus gyrociliatus]